MLSPLLCVEVGMYACLHGRPEDIAEAEAARTRRRAAGTDPSSAVAVEEPVGDKHR